MTANPPPDVPLDAPELERDAVSFFEELQKSGAAGDTTAAVRYAGATLALKKQRHIKLEILLRYAGHRTRRLARLLGSLFGMLVMGFLFAASLTFVKNEMAIFGLQGGPSVVFPLFFALSFFRCLLSGLVAVRPTTVPASDGRDLNLGTIPDDPSEGGA